VIPVADNVPAHQKPLVTWALIAVNVLMFLYELALGPWLEPFLFTWGLVPREFTAWLADPLNPQLWRAPVTVFTSMFLHGGFAHLLGNMLFLWIFGDNVEDNMGHGRYLAFYLLCGVLAGLAQVAVDPLSPLPGIGASGAISGVLGAYLVLYPHAVVSLVVPLFLLFPVIDVPAVVMIGVWFLTQFTNGLVALTLQTAQTGGVAWWAHIGGFVAGLALVLVFRRPRPHRRHVYDWYEWVDW
jgi:membrane associated rhomboid family serine protease